MIDCDHTKLQTAFCPQCGETNEFCTDAEKLTCTQLIRRAITTATQTKERHRRSQEEGPENNTGYYEDRMRQCDRKLAKLNKAKAWVKAQETSNETV